MERLQEISEYLEGLKIKRTLIGGYDREDVDAKLGELQDMIQECMEEQEEQERLLEDYDFRLHTSRMLVKKLKKKLREMTNEQESLELEKEKLKETYKEYCSNILQKYSESLRTLSTEFSEILDNITNLQKNIIDAESFEELQVNLDVNDAKALPEQDVQGFSEQDGAEFPEQEGQELSEQEGQLERKVVSAKKVRSGKDAIPVDAEVKRMKKRKVSEKKNRE